MRPAIASLLALFPLFIPTASADEIGRLGLDLKGNDMVIEALDDPKVEGVTCHLSRFDRGTLDRVMNGNWFENPSNTSIACRQTGPIKIGDINTSPEGEIVFSQKASLILKYIRIRRILDAKRKTLVYVAYSSEITDSSAKNSISTVAFWNQDVALPHKR